MNDTTPAEKKRRASRLVPALRRDKLLACAIRVFGRKGVAFARHSDVAREAKVSLSTVFAYFPTRQALLEAVLDELSRWALHLAKRSHRVGLSPRQSLYEHLVQLADLLETDPEYARVWLSWSMVVDKDLSRSYLKLQRRVVRIIAETVRRGQRNATIAPELNPEDVGLLIIGGAYVIAQTKLMGRRLPELERFARMLVNATVPRGGRSKVSARPEFDVCLRQVPGDGAGPDLPAAVRNV